MAWNTENYHGSDCTGSDGDANRVLTIANTDTTGDNGFMVFADGLGLTNGVHFTASHASSDTTITFLNKLWDDMNIVVNYYAGVEAGYADRRNDFQDIVLENGTNVTLKRETETKDPMGNTTSIVTDSYSIVYMKQDITGKDRQIHEMGLAVPGNSKAFFYHQYLAAMTGNGDMVVHVGDIIEDATGNQWRIEQILGDRYMTGEEIFKSAIIKRINLDETSV